MHRVNSFQLLLLAGTLSLTLIGCPRKSDPPDAGEVDAGAEDASVDAGPVDGGFKCRIDDDCAVFKAGLRCDTNGACIPGTYCQQDSDCRISDPDSYCFAESVGCRCAPEENNGGYAGVCRRRRSVCEPCTDDSQCGLGASFDPPGSCKALQGDSSGKKYCFQQKPTGSSQCACGMIDDGTGFCIPQSRSCDSVGCRVDNECPAGSVCNSNSCLCETRCRWDFRAEETVPACPPNKSCWVDSRNLEPDSIFYGAGRCRDVCSNNEQCTNTTINPHGGLNLQCGGEKTKGGESPARCRAAGECMDDYQCKEPEGSIYLGYCDRKTFDCKSDCRVGVDPSTGKPFKDCIEDYQCKDLAGVRTCVRKACADQGGALACYQGHLCCGQDRNQDGQPDPCPPNAAFETNMCYVAQRPPFCTPCQTDAECEALGNVSGSKLPNLCLPAPLEDGAPGPTICAPSTWNDFTLVGASPKAVTGCPAGYDIRFVKPDMFEADPNNECQTNSDCNVGTDAGVCDFDLSITFQDGTHPKSCLCTNEGSQCPNEADAGVTSVCRFGLAGVKTTCIRSVVCLPRKGMVVAPVGAPQYGCGIQ